jgi:hypothetical protein
MLKKSFNRFLISMGISTALLLVGLTISQPAMAQIECANNCICHNIENNPHTICVGEPGYDNHMENHLAEDEILCGACCGNGTCDTEDGEICSNCAEDCGECTKACEDGDEDSDGICNLDDNCPNDANQNQEDLDGDGFGDACDDCDGDNNIDEDDNGIPDACDVVEVVNEETPSDGVFLNGRGCSLNPMATVSGFGIYLPFFFGLGFLVKKRLGRK